jgi:hypothetical protein
MQGDPNQMMLSFQIIDGVKLPGAGKSAQDLKEIVI